MVKLENTIKDLITFYIKENYNKYLNDNNLTKIDNNKIHSVINELYNNKKEHLKLFLKNSIKELLKKEYPGDLVINNICFDIFQDDNLCINRVVKEIELYQENNL